MNAIEIKQKVDELRNFYGLAEPEKLAIYSGVQLLYSSNLHDVLGMYTQVNRCPFIFINERLATAVQKLVIAHELGHALLHGSILQQDIFTSTDLSRLGQKFIIDYEHEANLFAAFLLIKQKELFEFTEQGLSLYDIAKALNLCPEIICYYYRAMRNDHKLSAKNNISRTNLMNMQQTISFWQNYRQLPQQ